MRTTLEDLHGTLLVVDNTIEPGHVSIAIGYEIVDDQLASAWCHLTREQTAELFRVIEDTEP